MKENFKIISEEGKLIKYDVLLTFKNEENSKNYIIYTDNSTDKNGNIKIYIAGYNSNDKDLKLIDIESEEESKYINIILNSIKQQLDKK